MTLITLAGFFILTTLPFRSIEGKNLFLLDTGKNADIKQSEKRVSNFRLNVETPFDPNFWPARGRRGRRDFEKIDNCIASDEYFEIQCQPETRAKDSDSDTAANSLESGIYKGDCCGNVADLKAEGFKRSSVADAANTKLPQRLNRLMSNKRRWQMVLPLSRLMAYGNRVYYEPNNSFGEKMKKQDVFWVVRGKRNFQ